MHFLILSSFYQEDLNRLFAGCAQMLSAHDKKSDVGPGYGNTESDFYCYHLTDLFAWLCPFESIIKW
jgi:hypothetical protein